MTNFEYIAGANTLILSFAVVRLLAGIPEAIRPERRYWVHTMWLMLGLVFCLIGFWVFLSYRAIEWTLPRFMGVLVAPALIYIYSSLLAPTDPSSVVSWRDHFFRIRPYVFATGVLTMTQVLISNHLFLGVPLVGGAAWTSNVLLMVFAAGYISANPRLHAIIAFIPPILAVLTILSISAPDSLAP
jgi:hypothetical protein